MVVRQKRSIAYNSELIGVMIEVINSSNESEIGIKGKIIDETKSTIVVDSAKGKKTLLKKNITFKIQRSGEIIFGKELDKKPEERLKN